MSARPGLACVALLGLACSPPAQPRTLVVAVPSGPLSLQPNTINEEFTLSVQSNAFETLVDFDDDLTLRPGLAQSWVTLDDFTWVFRLRPGLRLHDGRWLEAADVARSLEHARSDPDSRRRLQLEPLESVRALDAHTLELRTKRAFDMLPSRLGNVFVWSPGADGQPVGTGPYRVREWSATGPTRLTAFEHYHGGAPPIREVEFRVIADPTAQARELLAGRVHLVLDVSRDDIERLRASPDLHVLTRAGLRFLFLGLDVARARSPYVTTRVVLDGRADVAAASGGGINPLRDVRVRRALALAVDRDGLVRDALGGLAEVVDQIAAPIEGGAGRREEAHDPAAARRLLAEAGYEQGFRVGLHFMPTKYRAMERVVAALTRDLDAVGVELVPLPCTPADMLARVERRDLSFYLLGWISDIGDAVMSYEYLLHTPQGGFGVTNGGGYSNARLDALVSEASGRLTPRQRRERLAEAARLVRDDVPLLPLYRQLDVYAVAAALDFTPRLDRRVRAASLRFVR